MTPRMISRTLHYGSSGELQLDLPASGDSLFVERLTALPNPPEAIRAALRQPLDFPPLARSVVPGDRVVIALDRLTPQGPQLIAELWRELASAGVTPEQLLILQPTALDGSRLTDPRSELPAEIRSTVAWKIHDATNSEQIAYLANTTNGERVYLARELVEADLVLTVGEVAFDSLLGFKGTGSVLYPGLSNVEAIRKSRGSGHQELSLEDIRPLRQMQDEISWLLGVQFSVQVLAGAAGGISQVWAGFESSVQRAAREELLAARALEFSERKEVVVLALEEDAPGFGWPQIGVALEQARNVVSKGGKIVLLTEFAATPETLGDGLRIVQQAHAPREALRPLRELLPPDYPPATSLARATDWATVYFVGEIAPGLAEELSLIPLDSSEDVQRLIEQTSSLLVLSNAQHLSLRLEQVPHPSV